VNLNRKNNALKLRRIVQTCIRFFLILATTQANRPDLSFREDVTKLQKGDFFASKLIVFSVTFGRKTKESQPPTGAARSGGISLRFMA
jgi:hypothetical protein